MTGPLIHIGYHKTGTTWFQERFYPEVRNAAYVPRALVRSAIVEPRAFAFSADAAREQILSYADGRRPLLCEENLSGYVHNGGLGGLVTKEVAERLRAVFPEAQIVIFLRSQPALVGAAYAQYVRAGGTYDLPTYLGWAKRKGASKYWYKAPAFAFDHLEYQPLLDHYAECFGRAAISVHLFEDFAADARAFIQAFAASHDLDVDIDALAYSPVNRSLSPRQLRILARLNLLTARSVPNKRWISDRPDWYARRWTWLRRAERWLGWAYSDEPLLSPAARDRIAFLFAASNAELERSWGLALTANGYPLPSPGDGTPGPERPRATNGRNFPL